MQIDANDNLKIKDVCFFERKDNWQMTTVYIIRHGETDFNRLYRFIGSTDHPLNERGIAQAETLREPMSKFALDRIYSSPLKRTMMTAERVRNGRDLEIIEAPGLREIHCGAWEGLNREEIEAKWPGEINLWEKHPHLLHMEGGETFAEVQDRAISAFCKIVARERGNCIAITSHMLTIQLIMGKLLNVPICDVWEMVRLENTSITTMTIEDNGDFAVVRWADDSHLPQSLKNANVKIAGIHNTSFEAKYDISDVEGSHHFSGFAVV